MPGGPSQGYLQGVGKVSSNSFPPSKSKLGNGLASSSSNPRSNGKSKKTAGRNDGKSTKTEGASGASDSSSRFYSRRTGDRAENKDGKSNSSMIFFQDAPVENDTNMPRGNFRSGGAKSSFIPYPRFPNSGFVDCLEPHQKVKLEQLRSQAQRLVPSPGSACLTDVVLLRFLRARGWDVEAASAMYSGFVHLRKEQKLDEPAPPRSKELMAARRHCYPSAHHGVDIYGRPIYIERLGQVDVGALVDTFDPDQLKALLIREYEDTLARRLPAASLSKGSLVEHTVNIVDLEGLRWTSLSRSAIRQLIVDIVQIQQSHFPEVMGQGFIINAPMTFSSIWLLISGLLGENTKHKIKVFGAGQKEACRAALLEIIPADCLPDFLGGYCTCSVAGGCLQSDIGPWHEPWIIRELRRRPGWQVQLDFAVIAASPKKADSADDDSQADQFWTPQLATALPPVGSEADEDSGSVSESSVGLMLRLQWEAASAEARLRKARAEEVRLQLELELRNRGLLPGLPSAISNPKDCCGPRDNQDPLVLHAWYELENATCIREACSEVFRGKMQFYRRAKKEAEELHARGLLPRIPEGLPCVEPDEDGKDALGEFASPAFLEQSPQMPVAFPSSDTDLEDGYVSAASNL